MSNRPIFILILIFSLVSSINAQFSSHKSNPYSNTIILSLNGGLSQGETDFSSSEFGINSSGMAEYFFTTSSDLFWGLKFESGYSQILGNNKSGLSNNNFATNVISFGPSVNLNYQLNKSIFPFIELGVRNLWYNNFTSLDIVPQFGIRYLLSNYFSVNGIISFNFLTKDNLDDLVIKGSRNDFYSTFSLSFSYAVDLTITDDLDNDGIKNVDDNCPEQAEDFDGFEDQDGCPEYDNDKDGIVDLRDSCVNEPEDFDGFEDSDGCPDLDNDGDGILDEQDNCPDIKEDFDGFEDSDGCPELDNDGDGILDSQDKCPNEPETFNNFEDSDGCPDELPAAEIYKEPSPKIEEREKTAIPETKIRVSIPNEFSLEGEDIFISNTASIKLDAHNKLNSIADLMKQNSEFRWRIEGHLDNSGPAFELKVLSTARANAIMEYFIAKGLSPKSFQAIGLADEFPLAPNSTIQGRLKNRRIIIKRIR